MIKRAWQRYFSTLAALLCAVSVAMSAYASHGLNGYSKFRMMMACIFAFMHGLSLLVLVRVSPAITHAGACSLMLLGTGLFCGSLASSALWHTSTVLAPLGGITLIMAWCWVAINFLILKED
jgi:uncharacterized membrane protein YgdD (TMEM256/DUF423 family)